MVCDWNVDLLLLWSMEQSAQPPIPQVEPRRVKHFCLFRSFVNSFRECLVQIPHIFVCYLKPFLSIRRG
jgi:hypothetical protein